MKTLFASIFTIIALSLSIAANAAQPDVRAILNQSKKSFDLEFKNAAEAEIVCKSVYIKLEIGTYDCNGTTQTVTDIWKNLRIKPYSSISDTNYGLEVMEKLKLQASKLSKKQTHVFCGEPEFKFDCIP
jgi:hypothetical protein